MLIFLVFAAVSLFQSTHPVRGGTGKIDIEIRICGFQSTHPVRGGTYDISNQSEEGDISIHPPREGWDCSVDAAFNTILAFQSTHPVRGGTTACWVSGIGGNFISIHPPREGWDTTDQ